MTLLRLFLCAFALALASTVQAMAEAGPPCDPGRGAEVFATKCTSCHSLDPEVRGLMGPSLRGVVGRTPGRTAGFTYSPALLQLANPWTASTLDWFLADPIGRVPGTYMAFTGVSREADRRALICYLGEAH